MALFLPVWSVNISETIFSQFLYYYFSFQLEKRLKELQESREKDENELRGEINQLQQEKRQLQETVVQYQANEQKQKHEYDQLLYRAQEMQEILERETQEKFASIAEQKSLRQQVENLSKNMKSLQVSFLYFFVRLSESNE